MADSKLRMTIVTALDNAGIKATQDQINGLVSSIQKVNRSSAGATSGMLGDIDQKVNSARMGLKSFVKDIGIAVAATKAVGTAAAKIFEDTAVNGESLKDSIIGGFSDIGNSISKFLFGTSVKEQFDKVTDEAKKSAEAQVAGIRRITDQLRRQETAADDVASTYEKQFKAFSKLQSAQDKAANIGLETEKLKHSEYMRQTEGDEAAQQIEDIYSIRANMEKKLQDIAQFDAETSVFEAKLESTKQKLKLVDEAQIKAQTQRDVAKKMYERSEADAKSIYDDMTAASPLGNDEGGWGIAYRFSRKFLGNWLVDGIEKMLTPSQDKIEDNLRTARATAVSATEKSITALGERRKKLVEQQVLDTVELETRAQERENLIGTSDLAIMKSITSYGKNRKTQMEKLEQSAKQLDKERESLLAAEEDYAYGVGKAEKEYQDKLEHLNNRFNFGEIDEAAYDDEYEKLYEEFNDKSRSFGKEYKALMQRASEYQDSMNEFSKKQSATLALPELDVLKQIEDNTSKSITKEDILAILELKQ